VASSICGLRASSRSTICFKSIGSLLLFFRELLADSFYPAYSRMGYLVGKSNITRISAVSQAFWSNFNQRTALIRLMGLLTHTVGRKIHLTCKKSGGKATPEFFRFDA
jgi:hypothetical protein